MAWPRKIYCACRNIGVYYTDNFVDPAIQPIWATVNTGLGSLDCMEFHLDPFDQANIQYVLTYEPKLYRRQFGGGWTKILDTDDITALLGGTHYNTNMTSFYPDPVVSGRIWAVVYDGGVGVVFVRSDDRGDNWYTTNTPAMGTYYGSDTIRSYDNYLVYSGLWGVTNRIYLSDDTGATWTDIGNFATPSTALIIHPLLGDTFYYCQAGEGFKKYEFGVGGTLLSGTEWIQRYDGMMFDLSDALHQRILYNGKLFVTADDWANISDSGVIDGGPLSFADWGGAAPLDIDQILVTMGVSLIAGQYHHCGVLEGEGDTTAVGISGTNCNNAPLFADSIPDDVGGVCKSGLAPLRESQGVIYTNAVAMPGYSDTGDERGVPMPGDRGDWDAKNYPLRHANDIDLVTGIHHTLGTDPGQASPGNHTHALDDLSDVTAPAPADLDVLTWDAGTGQWISATGGVGMGNAITYPVFQVEGALIVTPDVNGVYICPRAGVIIYVYIYCRDPGSASSTIVDVNLNGVSIFAGTPANRPTLAWNDADQVARSGVPDTTAVSENDVLSIDIDQIGTGAKDLTVVVSMDIGTVASGDHDHSGAVGSGGQFDADHLLSTGAGDGDVLTSDGAGNSAWEAIPPPPPPSLALDDLTDVNAPAPNDQDALIWDAGAGEWVSQVPPGGADANAIHVNQANEISGIANKAIPDNADLIVIEDSAAGYIKKSVEIGDLTGGMIFTDANAIHTNVDNEISGLAPKAAPVAGDLIVIEDSEDGFNKKSVDIDNLPGGGSGDSTFTDAYASRPAPSNDGDLFLPSDGHVIERDTGAAWVPWGPIHPLTSPILGDFAWVNQGGATAVDTYGGIHLVGPAGAALNWRILKKAAPGTPYTLTTMFLHNTAPFNYISTGICFRESATGKLAILRFIYYGGYSFNVTYYTNETTYSSDPISWTPGGFPPQSIWFRLVADGTNLVYKYSWDGENFITFLSALKAAFFTTAPNEIGFCVQPQNASYIAEMKLLHWKVT